VKRFISQKYNTNCFPIALKNCAIYLDRKLNVKKFIQFCCCDTGAALKVDAAVLLSKLPLEKTDKIEDVVTHGGIITIMHPIFNLHSAFCFPAENDMIMVINSWLGCNEIPFDKEALEKYLAKSPNNTMFYILK